MTATLTFPPPRHRTILEADITVQLADGSRTFRATAWRQTTDGSRLEFEEAGSGKAWWSAFETTTLRPVQIDVPL